MRFQCKYDLRKHTNKTMWASNMIEVELVLDYSEIRIELELIRSRIRVALQ